jgi:hypothetical protein
MANENSGEAGANAPGGEGARFFSDFLLDGGGDGRAVENLGHAVLRATGWGQLR